MFVADTRNTENPGNWGSPNNITALNRPIVSRYTTAVQIPTNEQNDFLLQINPDGRVVFFLGGGVDYAILMYGITQLNDNQWYHIGFSLEYTPDVSYPTSATVYVNGWATGARIRLDRDALTNAPWILGLNRNYLVDQPIALGKYINNDENWPEGQYFVGKMDEARFYSGVRLTTDNDYFNINFYPNRTVTGSESWLTGTRYSLVAAYNFNDGTGSVLRDQSSNKFHGTILPGPLNHAPEWSLSEVQIVSFENIVGQVPQLVSLIGYDVDKGPASLQFQISYNEASLGGKLFRIDSFGAPPAGSPTGIYVPTPGAQIFSGDIITDTDIVYVSNPGTNGQNFRFFYNVQTTDASSVSRNAEVRLIINCCCATVNDKIDDCGVCNGRNTSKDICGVCFGDGTSCLGCDSVPHSGKQYDRCGVCGGTDACSDCFGTLYGSFRYDVCGICNGDNSTCTGGCDDLGGRYDRCGVCAGNNACVGCDGVIDSGKQYDRCGVCNGANTCVGCDNVAFSGKVVDLCGQCGGTNACIGCDGVKDSGKSYDNCGVCDGTNDCSTEIGCDGRPGGLQYDVCGVCGGHDDCIGGCDQQPFSTATYDRCGVCDGTNACVGCDGAIDSGLKYDSCGVCDGDDIACRGCDFKPWSGFVYDDCGICGGNNGTCRGCDGSGGGVYDECGVCNGDNSTCGGCDGLGSEYDSCGVCAGDDSSCTCQRYRGYNIEEMDYVLLRWTMEQTLKNIERTENKISDALDLLDNYDGEVDLGSVSKFINEFIDDFVDPYTNTLGHLEDELNRVLGLEFVAPGGPTWPGTYWAVQPTDSHTD